MLFSRCHWEEIIGACLNMNLCCLPFAFQCLAGQVHGDCVAPSLWNEWLAPCQQCQLPVNGDLGLFCMNFAFRCGHWTPCQGAWCNHCYRDDGELKFPVAQPEDKDGFPLVDNGDKDHFMYGRKGDHLMLPFQCDLCHFRNMQRGNPINSG